MPDDDVEARIEQALRNRAVDAPRALAGDLAATARRRVRRRRHVTMTGAAALVAVVAFGGVWSMKGPETFTAGVSDSDSGAGERAAAPDSRQSPLDRASPGIAAAAGWRWESFGGVEVSVPSGWGYGVSGAPWCLGDRGQPDGEVGRPGPVRTIGCPATIPADRLGEHVWLTGAGADGPANRPATQDLDDGWVRDTLRLGSVWIEVQTHRNPAVREQILRSVRQVGTDVNGCPADHRISADRPIRPVGGLDWAERAVTGVSICRYQIFAGAPTGHPLIGSVRLAPAAAGELLRAIAAAPQGTGPDSPGGLSDLGEEATVLRFDTAGGVREVFVRYNGTRDNGFDNGATRRKLTRESLAFMTGPLTVSAGQGVVMDLLPRPR